MNLAALTSHELEATLQAIDALSAAYELLVRQGALDIETDEISVGELMDAIVGEMTHRAHEDAAVRVNQMVGRGEVDRYVRPDGEVGYGPALGANQDADWEL